MSWQCPTCETVNQDVTPVCTVCDCLAPVIQSFLSLEAIELSSEYNEKLKEVHRLQMSGDYNKMLDVALGAISIYRENGLAVEKAKQALLYLNNDQLKSQLSTLLDSTIEKKSYIAAAAVIRLIENFHFEVPDLASLRSEVKSQLSREKDIDEILKASYKFIVTLDLAKASEVVKTGLEKYPSSKLLQFRRDDIRNLSTLINNLQKGSEIKKRPFPKLPYRPEIMEPDVQEKAITVISLDKKRKFPKPKRK